MMGQLGMIFIEMFTTIIPFGDKLLHLIIGNFIFYSLCILSISKTKAWVLVLLIGLSKEIYDIVKTGAIKIENALDLAFTVLII